MEELNKVLLDGRKNNLNVYYLVHKDHSWETEDNLGVCYPLAVKKYSKLSMKKFRHAYQDANVNSSLKKKLGEYIKEEADVMTAEKHLPVHKSQACSPYSVAGHICMKAHLTKINSECHIVVTSSDKCFECNICGKMFRRNGHLKRHKLTHTGVKEYKCDSCEKCFTLNFHLKRHKLIHSGIKDYKCEICQQSFAHASNLKRHQLVHTGVKDHNCDICGQNFARSSSLRDHKSVHSGVRDHKCDICGKSFARKGDLKRHALVHTREGGGQVLKFWNIWYPGKKTLVP